MSFCQVKGFKVKTSLIPAPVIAAEMLGNCLLTCVHERSVSPLTAQFQRRLPAAVSYKSGFNDIF